jgi:hypothetical protein
MPPKSSQAVFFRPQRDWWITLAGAVIILLALTGVPYVLWSGVPVWQQAVTIGVLLLMAVSVVDKVFFTVYELNSEGVAIHTQLRHYLIPYRVMREIHPGGLRGLITTKQRKRYALSRRNLIISITDSIWSEVSVSPEQMDTFLDTLLATIDGERSRRATVTRSKPTKR